MWPKLYVGIVVVLVLLFLQAIEYFVSYLDREYSLASKYNLPIKCFSTALCGMNGNIFLLFMVYMIIPSEYYEKLLDVIDPKKLQKTAETDAAGLEAVTDKLADTINHAAGTVVDGLGLGAKARN